MVRVAGLLTQPRRDQCVRCDLGHTASSRSLSVPLSWLRILASPLEMPEPRSILRWRKWPGGKAPALLWLPATISVPPWCNTRYSPVKAKWFSRESQRGWLVALQKSAPGLCLSYDSRDLRSRHPSSAGDTSSLLRLLTSFQ